MNLWWDLIPHLWWSALAVIALLVLRRDLWIWSTSLARAKSAPMDSCFERAVDAEGLSKPRLAALRSLSADEFDLFLFLAYGDAQTHETGLPPEQYLRMLRHLDDAGLITNVDDTNPRFVTHEITPLGGRFRALIISSVAVSVRDSDEYRRRGFASLS